MYVVLNVLYLNRKRFVYPEMVDMLHTVKFYHLC